MKRLLPFALILAACGPGGGGDDHQPDSGASGRPTESTTTAATRVTTPSTTSPTMAPPVAVKGNPSRLYQLEDLKKVDVEIKGHKVHLWVMDDDSKQNEGMMFLEEGDVKADEGMLFAFDSVQPKTYPDGRPRGFWMHNTLIPLDIIYLSPSGQVLNVAHGNVQDDTTVAADGEFRNVIELKAGTAARFGLKPGDTIALPKAP